MAAGQMGGNFRSGNQANKGANTSQNFENKGCGTSYNFGNLNQRSGKHIKKSRPRKVKYDPNVSCDHYGKTGHLKLDCFRLIGFPEDFQSKEMQLYQQKTMKTHTTNMEKHFHMITCNILARSSTLI
uniref:Gag-pol polyprotein n=1 Tax=Solanum tuberosum TaxID=4113 RepID=M1DDP0_SOLTU